MKITSFRLDVGVLPHIPLREHMDATVSSWGLPALLRDHTVLCAGQRKNPATFEEFEVDGCTHQLEKAGVEGGT
ncbi:hypothetical protein B5F76_10915 [Desulfovibrio sp. An276]|nr:hypothetical protein B5F76_10915 [Desulfovibrio sp. An276]